MIYSNFTVIEIPKDHLFFLSIFKGVNQHHQYPVYISCLAILIIPCRSLTTRMIAVAGSNRLRSSRLPKYSPSRIFVELSLN